MTKSVWVWCPLLDSFPVVRVSLPWLIKLLGGISATTKFHLRDSSLDVWEVQRKPVSAFAGFQVPAAQNNRHTKVAYLRGVHVLNS